MNEREMEDLLWKRPEDLLKEPFRPVARQICSKVGRADLELEHPCGYRLLIELKRGKAPRGVGGQLLDYYGAAKVKNPEIPYEMMVVANEIPVERRLLLNNLHIEAREISEREFRRVADSIGYTFASELVPAAGTELDTDTVAPVSARARSAGSRKASDRSASPRYHMARLLRQGTPVRKCMLILKCLAEAEKPCEMVYISRYMRRQYNEHGDLYTDDTYADAANALEDSGMIERVSYSPIARKLRPEGLAFLQRQGWLGHGTEAQRSR